MNNKIINKVIYASENEDEWNYYLNLAGGGDIYHCSNYHRLHENYYKSKALAIVVQQDDKVFFHPFFLHPINNIPGISLPRICNDIQSVYGYSGPVATTSDSSFLEKSWDFHFQWCKQNDIIAEFIRFNPLLGNHIFAQGQYEIVNLRKTIYMELPNSTELLFDNYPSVQRNMIRKAQKAGLSVFDACLDEHMDTFQGIYISTMQRLNADNHYHFDSDYFKSLSAMKDNVKLFLVKYNSEIIAGSLFLTYDKRMHYHLSGCNANRQNIGGISNLLIDVAAQWGVHNGFNVMHLGGGRTNEPTDSLFKFKQSISKSSFNYFIGKRVHDREAYGHLRNSWKTKNKEKSPYFLFYRQ